MAQLADSGPCKTGSVDALPGTREARRALCREHIRHRSDIDLSDIFAALIEHRRYKPTMPREQAYEIIQGMQRKLEKPLVLAFRDVALNR